MVLYLVFGILEEERQVFELICEVVIAEIPSGVEHVRDLVLLEYCQVLRDLDAADEEEIRDDL